MICNQLMRIPVFLLFSAAIILVVSEPQSESSNYHPAGLLQSLLTKWKQFFDETKLISKNDVDKTKSVLSTNIEKQQTTSNVISERPAPIGSMVPLEENLVVPQFLGVGRQQITACTCNAVTGVDGIVSCVTTCTSAQTTLCGGRVCTRTTTFFAFTSTRDPDPLSSIRQFQSIDENDCENLRISCILSSALATVAITTGVANVALAAGIAAGAVALGLAVKSKDTHDTYDDHYETEYHHDPPEYDLPKYYARRQSREAVLHPADVNRPTDETPKEKKDEIELISNNFDLLENEITGSIMEELISSNSGRQFRQGGCNCIPDPIFRCCGTFCYSDQTICGGQICIVTTFFTSFLYNNLPRQYQTTIANDCDRLIGACSLSTALTRSIQSCTSLASFAVITGALTAGLSAGNIAAVATAETPSCQQPQQPQPPSQPTSQPAQQQQTPQQQLQNQTPINNQPLPVIGTDCPDDGCDDNSVRFPDGNCYPIFSSCNDTNYWVTFDNATRLQNGCGTTGKCTPRLCDDRRVFVGRTGLCHDINDPIECPGGRRIYYSAFGDSICDCPIGQFPFPNPEDNCVTIFTRGPCPGGQVVTLSHGGRLFCAPDECQSQISNEEFLLSLVPSDRGKCQVIGSRGSCSSGDSQFWGYDIFNRRLQCTNVRNSSSPYFSFLRERRFEKKTPDNQQNENEINRKMSEDLIETVHQSLTVKTNETNYRRQDTFGLFQFPSSISNSLLQPCRTGAQQGFNQKCTNPLVSNSENRQPLPPVPPRFSCPSNNFLQAGGKCVNDRPTATCGPSYQFNPSTGQCRPRF